MVTLFCFGFFVLEDTTDLRNVKQRVKGYEKTIREVPADIGGQRRIDR